MASYNKVLLMGNLTRDVETRTTKGGSTVAKFSIAINRSYTQGEERKEEVTFVEIDAFGKQAETVAKYFQKGSPIFVEGRLKLDQWEDKQTGERRSKLGVTMEGFSFVGGKGQGGSPTSASDEEDQKPSYAPPPPVAPPKYSPPPLPKQASFSMQPIPVSEPSLDDDVPF